MLLNVRNFLSISLQLGLQACNIIKQSSIDKNLKKYQKGHDDHVTQADYKVQSMLTKGFKMYFPQLKIIGQETQQFKGQINFDYIKLNNDFIPKDFNFNSTIPIHQCCLWIDPIDCTKGFIQGAFQDVTVLIGVSSNNNPALGVIGIPFQKIGQKRVFNPQILFGSFQDKKAYKYFNNEFSQLKRPNLKNQNITVTTSNSRSNQLTEKFINHFKAKNILAGGSGRKISLVIRGQADIMAYVGSKTCKWDSCAGQSIIKAMGGNFTTPTGKNLTYNPNQSFQNQQGIFCSFNQEIHNKSIQFINMQNRQKNKIKNKPSL